MPRLTLILGGARSGKSRHAETLIVTEPDPWIYIATARAADPGAPDEEMRARIAAHRARRGEGWRTVEAPLEMPDALLLAADRPVLVDCLTLWLTNLMLSGQDMVEAFEALEDALDWRESPTILVASEVGLGIVPESALGRRFRDEAGVLHQRLAARADRVLLMVAGLPMAVK